MLDKIKFNGYIVNSTNFKVNKESAQGKFEINLDQALIHTSNDPTSDALYITLSSKPQLIGYALKEDSPDEYEDTPSFIAEVELQLNFVNEEGGDFSEQLYKETYWFFESFLAVATKLSLENIIKDTMFRSISLPWARPDVDHKIEEVTEG